MDHKPLTVIHLVSHDGRGGADKLAFDIARGLRQRGHRVIWGCPSSNFFLDKAHAAGLETYFFEHSDGKGLSALRDFLKFCHHEKVDIVNAHHSHGRHSLIVAKLLGLRSKAVFTRHCIATSMPHVGMVFYNFVIDMNIAVSDAVRQSIIQAGIWPSRAVTVYGGIDVDHFATVPSAKVRRCGQEYRRPGSFTIGTVARIGLSHGYRTDKPTMKRHEVLFRALSQVRKEYSLLLLGDKGSEDKVRLQQIARNNGLDPSRLTFCGFQDDITPFYKIMDLHILPSPSEGLGLAIIEAMAAGVPCIGAGSGGIKEIITDGKDGFLFTPGDYRELAQKIQVLMENRALRDTFIVNGKETVRKHFTIDKTTCDIEQAFHSLMNH